MEDIPKEAEKSQNTDQIIPQLIEGEMKKAYLAYSMSVIVSRALPDARDGLKPVHRRILFAMHEMGLASNKPFKKSARIVGEVLGKYHPHGDTAVYEAMVRMAQDFSMRYPLVMGQGNFGSIDNDPPAAMRYTEARLERRAEALLEDIEKNTVRFTGNFDGSLEEPTVIPAKIPNLLVNGTAGIAVGMATNMPPHNMKEITSAAIHVLENPECTIFDLLQHVPGPDFPTGGIIAGTGGIRKAYATGRGKVIIRGQIAVEENKDKQRLIISEVPFQVNKAALVEEIANLVRDKVLIGIADIRDESDRDGIRVVLELKSGANTELLKRQLFKHSRLQVSFGIINLALVKNEPKVLNLKELLQVFLNHREDIIIKRSTYELEKAKEKAHILEGLLLALKSLDAVINAIKKSADTKEARQKLIDNFELSEKQANAVLDMRLAKLTSLESDNIKKEHASLLEKITELESLLASKEKIQNVIKEELKEVTEKFQDERRTRIIEVEEDIDDEDLISREECVITLTQSGYVKRQALEVYRSQRRGGRGITATGTKEDDIVSDVFTANTHDWLLFFTNKGKVHLKKGYQVPTSGRYAKGTAAINLIALEEGEKVTSLIPVKEFDDTGDEAESKEVDENTEQQETEEREGATYLLMVTKRGVVKKTNLSEFSNKRKGGKLAIRLPAEDELIAAKITTGSSEILIATHKGMAVRFNEKDVRSMGRTAYGVRGIRLKKGDEVVSAAVCEIEKTFLSITEKGFGKRSEVEDYRKVNRGGVGVINLKVTEKNGPVIAVLSVLPTDDILLISEKGVLIRTKVERIPVIGRNTQGVRLMRVDEGDRVVSATRVDESEQTDETGSEASETTNSVQ